MWRRSLFGEAGFFQYLGNRKIIVFRKSIGFAKSWNLGCQPDTRKGVKVGWMPAQAGG